MRTRDRGRGAEPRVGSGYLVGAKALARSGGLGVAMVRVARDAPDAVTSPVRRLAAAWDVPLDDAETGTRLGERCGLGRPVAALGELKSLVDGVDS